MSDPTRPFESPDAVEAAYYAAFEAADLDAMMEIWADQEDLVCVHPVGGQLLRGRRDVLEGWVNVFARELDMRITLSEVTRFMQGDLAIHSGVENIVRRGDPGLTGRVVFTNVYRRTGQGWKMILHHASPGVRPPSVQAPEGFMDDFDPESLH